MPSITSTTTPANPARPPMCPICMESIRPTCLTAKHVRPCTTCGRSFAPVTHTTCLGCTRELSIDVQPWNHESAMAWLERQGANGTRQGPGSDSTIDDPAMQAELRAAENAAGNGNADVPMQGSGNQEEEAAWTLLAMAEDQRRLVAAEGLLMLSRGEDGIMLAVHALTVLKWQAEMGWLALDGRSLSVVYLQVEIY
ncbi:hypothetical protein BJY04DRAFT_215470 [Aspergillus karnatakaensis]|uniref:uncharacterized protein n=1 Tax=Aspergillus karnatakaensis TaxID=1810916 RepID=UPI003CCD3503